MILPPNIGFKGKCWYCKENMDNEEHIMWTGETIITLHVKCAWDFAHKLIEDSIKIAKKQIEQAEAIRQRNRG